MNTSLLSLKNISVQYGSTHLFQGISLDIKQGSINALIGENGSGKSTLLQYMIGKRTEVSGDIFFAGKTITLMETRKRSTLGIQYVGQHGEYWENMTVYENCVMGINTSNWGQPILSPIQKKILTDLLSRTGLEKLKDSKLSDVSFGQKKMVNLIKNIILIPKVLLLDEPFAGIHEDMTRSLISIFDIFREYNITVIFVEHKQSLYENQCDTLITLPNALLLSSDD